MCCTVYTIHSDGISIYLMSVCRLYLFYCSTESSKVAKARLGNDLYTEFLFDPLQCPKNNTHQHLQSTIFSIIYIFESISSGTRSVIFLRLFPKCTHEKCGFKFYMCQCYTNHNVCHLLVHIARIIISFYSILKISYHCKWPSP